MSKTVLYKVLLFVFMHRIALVHRFPRWCPPPSPPPAPSRGHKIKNTSTAVAKAVRALPSSCRLLLTGTPIQNNLDELWALFDYITAGALLGSARTFKREIGDRITHARDRQATSSQRRDGAVAADGLMDLIRPHMLRREKEKLLQAAEQQKQSVVAATAADGATTGTTGLSSSPDTAVTACPLDELEGAMSSLSLGVPPVHNSSSCTPLHDALLRDDRARVQGGGGMGAMGSKKELVLWSRISPLQRDLTLAFLASGHVRAALTEDKKGILAAITILQKIASHPVLLAKEWRDALLRGPEDEAVSEGAGARGRRQQRSLSVIMVDAEAGPPSTESSGDSDDSDDVAVEGDDDEGTRAGAANRCSSTADDDDVEGPSSSIVADWTSSRLPPVDVLVAMSGKLRLFADLMKLLESGGHRTLVFSKSKCMLDVLQVVLRSLHVLPSSTSSSSDERVIAAAAAGAAAASGDDLGTAAISAGYSGSERQQSSSSGGAANGVSFIRIDGDVDVKRRRALVDRFNGAADGVSVCLLTTGVGALGLTLTGADRVVIFDPAWNPGEAPVVLQYAVSCSSVAKREAHVGGPSSD